MLINKWIDQGVTEWTGALSLTAGKKYSIKMEYFDNLGGAVAALGWSSPSTTAQVIPTSQLFPYATAQTPPTAPAAPSAAAIDATTIRIRWTANSNDEQYFEVTNGIVSRIGEAGTTFYDWTGLSSATYMCFRVRATNSIGSSAFVPAVSPYYVCATTPTVATAGRYTPLTPARILDTRDGTGGISSPVGHGASVDVQITGRGGVPPSGVSAVAINVTVTAPTATGFLTLSPAGAARPLAANLNFTPGKTLPNLAVVKVGGLGKVALFNSAGSTHVIIDIAGWFSEVPVGNDGRLQPLVPARILDTRNGTGGGVRLGPGASLDVQVTGRGGVPATGVGAAVLNVAATSTTATSFLTVYPTGASRPVAANLNFAAGDTVSNRVMAKLGAGGKLTIYNNAGSTDVIVDVNGWYTDTSTAGASGVYNPLVPARTLDTRDGTGGITGARAANSTVDVQVTGRGGVPGSGVAAVILNVTVTQPNGPGFLTTFPTGTARPVASDLNYANGETRPNLVVVKVGTGGKVSLFTSAGTHAILDVAGWYAA